MFSQIHGLPVHPLAVHAAVVFVPLAAFLGILFVVPRTRAWSRIPLVLVSLAAVVAVFVARLSGLKLKESLGLDQGSGPVQTLLQKHQHRAFWLMIIIIIFAVIALAAYFLSRDPAKYTGPLAASVSGLLVVAAVVVAFQTYLVGDIGSRAVWNPTGQVDYSNSGK